MYNHVACYDGTSYLLLQTMDVSFSHNTQTKTELPKFTLLEWARLLVVIGRVKTFISGWLFSLKVSYCLWN